MQTTTPSLKNILLEQPVQSITLVASFLLLVFVNVPYPLSTVLLLLVMGLSFYFGGRYPMGEILTAFGRRTAEPLSREFDQALREAGHVVDSVADRAADLVESLTEESAPKPRARTTRRRTTRSRAG